jgi:hypothetical protein
MLPETPWESQAESGESLGRVWGESGESLGRVWGESGDFTTSLKRHKVVPTFLISAGEIAIPSRIGNTSYPDLWFAARLPALERTRFNPAEDLSQQCSDPPLRIAPARF